MAPSDAVDALASTDTFSLSTVFVKDGTGLAWVTVTFCDVWLTAPSESVTVSRTVNVPLLA